MTVDADQTWLKRELQEALADDLGREVRRAVGQELGRTFVEVGRALRVSGHIAGTDRIEASSQTGHGDDAVFGLGLVSGVAGELISSAMGLFVDGHDYAASALTRQLVEVEYLAWAFAEDKQEAANWLRSTREERRSFWQPVRLRQRAGGRFRGQDYGLHCEFGGHPTPQASRLLGDEITPLVAALSMLDLALHGTSTWRYALAAADHSPFAHDAFSSDARARVDEAIVAWRCHDRLWQLTRPRGSHLVGSGEHE